MNLYQQTCLCQNSNFIFAVYMSVILTQTALGSHGHLCLGQLSSITKIHSSRISNWEHLLHTASSEEKGGATQRVLGWGRDDQVCQERAALLIDPDLSLLSHRWERENLQVEGKERGRGRRGEGRGRGRGTTFYGQDLTTRFHTWHFWWSLYWESSNS